MDSYERLLKANETIVYTPITKGNKTTEYAAVSERVKAFRFIHPNGSITTKIVSQTETDVIVKAEIFDDNGALLATGHASENKNIGPVNKTSMLENAETGAVGRALGFLGIGIKGGISTFEGVQKAADYQDQRNHLTKCHRCGRDIIDTADRLSKVWTAQQIATMTMKTYGDVYCLPCVAEIKKAKTDAEV